MSGGSDDPGAPLPLCRAMSLVGALRRLDGLGLSPVRCSGAAHRASVALGGGRERVAVAGNAQESFSDDILTTITVRHRTTNCMATKCPRRWHSSGKNQHTHTHTHTDTHTHTHRH